MTARISLRTALFALPVMGFLALPALAAAPTVIQVDLDNMGKDQTLKFSPTSVPAGKVKFEVTNDSMDSEHEMIVVKTKLKPSEFPMNKDGSRVIEDKFKGAEEVSELKPGAKGELEMTLKPGHYVLFCNIKNHFKGGMYGELTVTN